MITAQRLREVLEYRPYDGTFWWKEKIAVKVVVGKRADWGSPGCYRRISLFGERHGAHRLAWLYVHGEWPKEIDHANRNPSDNRLANLRLATRSQNGFNKLTPLPVRGVRFDEQRKKWLAQIKINSRAFNLGRYQTQQEAKQIHDEVAHQAFGQFVPAPGDQERG